MAGPQTAAPSPTGDAIAGWAGLLVPYDQPSVDGRMIRRPPGGARIRDLPLELKYQDRATCGHDGAKLGLACITRVWETNEGLWGSGPFDLQDPEGAQLARKVDQGFVGHVSVDLGDFKTAAQQTSNGMVESVTDWKLLSTTIVADAAMDGARIFTVRDPERITPVNEPLTARRQAAGVFAADTADKATLTFAKARTSEHDEELTAQPGVTLTITGASNLPWAPEDTPWDAAAAQRRLVQHCGGRNELNVDCFARAFMFREAAADPEQVGSYKFPFADVVDGELRAVWRAVANAATRVDQAGITSADKEAVRGKIRALYASAGKAFGRDIPAPFSAATTATSSQRRAEMAEIEGMPDVGDQVSALAEEIVNALAPRMTEAVTGAIQAAIADVMASAVGTPPAEEEEEVVVEEDPMAEAMPAEADQAQLLSAVVLRMARAAAERRVAGAKARRAA